MARSAFDRPADPAMFQEIGPGIEDALFAAVTDAEGSAPGDLDNDYESRVRGMIDDAREFNAEVLTPIREKGIQFYMGLAPSMDEEAGSSTIVATEVRDTILQMLPSLMRLFTSQDTVVQFQPTSKHTAAKAKEQTQYINHVFHYDNPGYMILQDVFKDGLIKAMGCAQWWTDDNLEVREEDYTNLTLEARQYVISQPDTEVVNEEIGQRPGPQGEIIPIFSLTVRRKKRAPLHRIEAFPADELRINRTAKSVKTAALVGRERFATQSELILKGVPRELIADHRDFSGGDLRFSLERMLRNAGEDSPFGRDSAEPLVRYGEYWMRIDKDDDGIAELRHICTIGDNHLIVLDEPAARAKIAIACPDPEPHSIVGHSISELIADLQVIKTNLMRGSLDSLAQSIWPRIWGVDNLVNWDDVLNTAIGAPIRVKDANAIGQLNYAFIGQPAFDMMDRLDAVRMARTGVTEQSKGLDPRALQSTTVKGVEMIVAGAQERIELVGRTMAWTFMTDVFAGLLQETVDHPSPERVIKLRGEWIPVHPDQFDATMMCVPNPAIGKGSDTDRFMMLQSTLVEQKSIIQAFGPGNPMVSPVEYRNTLEDLLHVGGILDSERYYKALDPASLKAFLDTLNAKEDPNMVLAKAEADKVRAQIIEILANARVKTEDMALKDDRERDKSEGDQMLKAWEIDAKFQTQVDLAALQAMRDEPRDPASGGAPPSTNAPEAGPPPMPEQPQPMAGPRPPQMPPLMQRPSAPPSSPGAPPGLLSPQGPGPGG